MTSPMNSTSSSSPEVKSFPSTGGSQPNLNQELVLCLSGGGFRATLFHLGVVCRLNELGVLSKVNVITSVSGGSILNGVLATRWEGLGLQADGTYSGFDQHIAKPIRDFCSRDLRTRLLFGTRIDPQNWGRLIRDFFSVPADFLAEEYKQLLNNKSLLEIPAPDKRVPRFVFCATNTQTGACWHFHAGPEGRMGDFYTDYTSCNSVSVAQAVAASSSFPPGFAALRLMTKPDQEWSRQDPWGEIRTVNEKRPPIPASRKRQILLTDGGVYDNLGLEPVWRRPCDLLVSDAGMPFDSSTNCHQYLAARLSRAFSISANQVGAVRKRWLMDSFIKKYRRGTIWQIDTLLEDFPLDDRQGYSPRVRSLFPKIRTDLNTFTQAEMACLENHGYSLADAAIRSRASWASTRQADFSWPYPEWSDEDATENALKNSGQRRLLRDVLRYCSCGLLK